MAIMKKNEFDEAQLINVNKTNLFYRYKNISLSLSAGVG